MEYRECAIAGGFVVSLQPRHDERGYFSRVWCADESAERGMSSSIAQINTGWSPTRGTLRGMHLQTGADAEAKFVRCVRGKVFDVMVDLRPDSPSFCQWFGVELAAGGIEMLYIPPGCAHGYLTLTDDVELMYLTDRPYSPSGATGVRYDDPAFGIEWPGEVLQVSDADRSWPVFQTDHGANRHHETNDAGGSIWQESSRSPGHAPIRT